MGMGGDGREGKSWETCINCLPVLERKGGTWGGGNGRGTGGKGPGEEIGRGGLGKGMGWDGRE